MQRYRWKCCRLPSPRSCPDLRGLGGEPVLREGQKKDGPVITDNGNMVIDCRFGPIHRPEELEFSLTTIPGVLSCGIFSGFTRKDHGYCGGCGRCPHPHPVIFRVTGNGPVEIFYTF